MTRLATIGWGSDQFRVGPWNADAAIAYLAVAPQARVPTAAGIRHALDKLAASGYRGVTTAALRPSELPAFVANGFNERERLTILRHDLAGIDGDPARSDEEQRVVARVRRARRRDIPAVVTIDGAAFPPGWRLDADGLADALAATPRTRFRVVDERGPRAYAICGRADQTGYLQRLAVDPDHQGRGLAAALVLDALGWLRRRGASGALVNTQRGNQRALDLYRSMGFRIEPYELVVMERSLP